MHCGWEQARAHPPHAFPSEGECPEHLGSQKAAPGARSGRQVLALTDGQAMLTNVDPLGRLAPVPALGTTRQAASRQDGNIIGASEEMFIVFKGFKC